MAEKTRLKIELLLPDIDNADDRCVQRLTDLLATKKGVGRVHLDTREQEVGKICVHFDPTIITVGEVRQFAMQAGVDLANRYGHILVEVGTMTARHARQVAAQFSAVKGVLDVGVSPDGIVRIEFDRKQTSDTEMRRTISELTGSSQEKTPTSADSHEHHGGGCGHHHGGIFGENSELIFAILCGLALGVGWLISVTTELSRYIPLACYVLAYVFGGFFIVQEAIQKTLMGRFEIDFLMIVAAIGAAVLGQWVEGALLLFLFSIGHALEHYAMRRARTAIESLADLAPRTAFVKRDGNFVEVSVEQLELGDTVLVKTNEKIAADGFVIAGTSSVDQSPITGESVPVDKRPVDDREKSARFPKSVSAESNVYAGTLNQSGAMEIEVTKLAKDTTLSRVVTMVSEAETQTSPTQRFTDRFERYFVPFVIGLVALLHLAFLVVDESFADSFYRAMAVLVAASPCALAISTPSAVLSGIACAARGGVLIKGGGPLENLGRLDAIAFDKTGTLTEGKPRITDVEVYAGAARDELLRVAVAVEMTSDHPLAQAVVRDGQQTLGAESQRVIPASEVQSITGRGIIATVDSEVVYLGKPALFDETDGKHLPADLRDTIRILESKGRTTVVVRKGERFLGVIGLMDQPRVHAAETISELRALGIDRMIMISGDNQLVADAIALQVGIDEALGDLLPADKVHAIRELRQQRDVAMVGDGVNDAPAMANATVGIAMGAAGSDVALEAADIALMGDDLSRLPFAVGLSRQTSRIIRQNLWFSLGMVAVLVPATIFGLRLGLAVLFHEGSTMLVVMNALRLLAYRQKSEP